ncbi:hypothetical protein TruAng_006862 [Truncatella angustata]|nr:hypothetical protein TruAng_006862 [Truncatella angustata]
MDMGTMSMDMSGTSTTMDMSATSTAASAAAATTSAMSMSMGDGSSCKISMLWNWYTIDSCFIASSWHNTSSGMFAGSCIGVILLVMSLEFLRRAVKEYDTYLIRTNRVKTNPTASDGSSGDGKTAFTDNTGVRPNVLQQAVRAFLHTVQFAVAYFVMLLAMYYNGYIIICIFIGAFLGAFVFQWEILGK